MKKNNQLLIAALLLLAACSSKKTDNSAEAKTAIINADKAMNTLAAADGFNAALLRYADSAVIKPKEGELAVIGKANLEKYWDGKESTKLISWEPVLAEAATSGDMGYTFGNWKYTAPDTVLYGNYVTVWKKQKDGSWKFVYDGGNNTPAPK